jgi:DNA invertase Pin-like site-specific DNA recombinase
MKYAYARISTVDQNADAQLKALQRAGCKKDFESGQFCGETEQLLQRLVEAIELVLAQLVSRLEPQLLAD